MVLVLSCRNESAPDEPVLCLAAQRFIEVDWLGPSIDAVYRVTKYNSRSRLL